MAPTATTYDERNPEALFTLETPSSESPDLPVFMRRQFLSKYEGSAHQLRYQHHITLRPKTRPDGLPSLHFANLGKPIRVRFAMRPRQQRLEVQLTDETAAQLVHLNSEQVLRSKLEVVYEAYLGTKSRNIEESCRTGQLGRAACTKELQRLKGAVLAGWVTLRQSLRCEYHADAYGNGEPILNRLLVAHVKVAAQSPGATDPQSKVNVAWVGEDFDFPLTLLPSEAAEASATLRKGTRTQFPCRAAAVLKTVPMVGSTKPAKPCVKVPDTLLDSRSKVSSTNLAIMTCMAAYPVGTTAFLFDHLDDGTRITEAAIDRDFKRWLHGEKPAPLTSKFKRLVRATCKPTGWDFEETTEDVDAAYADCDSHTAAFDPTPADYGY
ncbi:MAG: uncharacterized protein KVP18_004472 [Porospora cf. gigantea A]|nr:MAG: hypothetical protein KVP18_004472 [Porospora cf. gigantea A]